MGNLETKPSDCAEQPWWSIENETFLLNQPNLSEIFSSISEPEEIKYPTVREKILAKLRDRKYSASSEDSEDQCATSSISPSTSTLSSSTLSSVATASAATSDEKYCNKNIAIKKFKNEEVKLLASKSLSSSAGASSSSESEPTTVSVTEETNDTESQSQQQQQTLDEFREELRIKRIARQTAINDLRSELNTLRQQLADERELNRKLRNGEKDIKENEIETKEIGIGTEKQEENKNENENVKGQDNAININYCNKNSSCCCSSSSSSNSKKNISYSSNSSNKSCDISVQTDNKISNNLVSVSAVSVNSYTCSEDDNLSDDDDNDDRRNRNRRRRRSVQRSPSDTQQINLKAQLAELQLSLQLANSDNLSLTTELAVLKKQVASLKEVITCSRQMIDIREEQVQQLKAKLRQIEDSLADRELKIMSENLRQEYDRQLANIQNLRQLYEERARVSAAERENLLRQIAIKKDELAVELLKVRALEERISGLENDLTTSKDKLNETKEERDALYIENKILKEEMTVINKLFSQMLTGFNGTDSLDIDRLTTMLEENRTLLNEIAVKESQSEGASLPKLLFDIVNQANKTECDKNNYSSISSSSSSSSTDYTSVDTSKSASLLSQHNIIDNKEKVNVNVNDNDDEQQMIKNNSVKVTSAQEIIGNLPKVWRILIEFLNHQKVEKVQFQENGQSEECYKSVQTSNGQIKSEISVSKTYLKLKDLILEKKSLMKETNKLKTLNTHLERRLDEQEKRLSVVSLELTKTWHLVGKMQRQHRQLHTHEQILRYQLQQKKRLLNELKDELEYCRRKWAAAKAKNAESQIQCDDLRKEFARRKLEDASNSGESGYSDGPPSSDEETSLTTKKHFKEFLDVAPRKIERTLSTSPSRSSCLEEDFAIRCSSAPPVTTFLTELLHTADDITLQEPLQSIASTSTVPDQAVAKATLPPPASRVGQSSSRSSRNGAIPKQGVKNIKLSRGKKLETYTDNKKDEIESLEEMFKRISGMQTEEKSDLTPSTPSTPSTEEDLKRVERAERIQRLEEQCKNLIAQVIETSDSREKLQVQICQFQDEIGPAQHSIPFEEYLARRRSTANCIELSSESNKTADETVNTKIDESSYLTAREEEYTSRRSERLKRLEEESNQLLSKIKRTTERGNSMKTLLDKIHSRCVSSREGSIDSSHSIDDTEDREKEDLGCEGSKNPKESEYVECDDNTSEVVKNGNDKTDADGASALLLTPQEEEYTKKRSERLKRLEEESKLLMTKLSRHSQRGTRMNSRIDALHQRYGSEENDSATSNSNDDSKDIKNNENQSSILENEFNNDNEINNANNNSQGTVNLSCDEIDNESRLTSTANSDVTCSSLNEKTETGEILNTISSSENEINERNENSCHRNETIEENTREINNSQNSVENEAFSEINNRNNTEEEVEESAVHQIVEDVPTQNSSQQRQEDEI